jgi:large subunit ribosomal protein L25
MARIKLGVAVRSGVGTNLVKRLREDGIIPGIIYGKGKEPIPVQVTTKDLYAEKGVTIAENMLLDLSVKDEKGKPVNKTVIIKEIQKDFIRGDWLHIDFNEISLEEKLKTKVEIDVVGDAVGVSQGGILDQIMHELEIECLPVDIPGKITIDVSSLSLGHTIYVKDIVIPEKVTVLTNVELPVVSVSVPKAEEEVVAAPVEGETAEPEVIKKGKKEEEEVPAEKAGEAKPKEEAKTKEEKKEK